MVGFPPLYDEELGPQNIPDLGDLTLAKMGNLWFHDIWIHAVEFTNERIDR
jgi:hypothetical protein